MMYTKKNTGEQPPMIPPARVEMLSIKQREAIEWVYQNQEFLNAMAIERQTGMYPQALHKWIKGQRGLSLAVATKLADWAINFRT